MTSSFSQWTSFENDTTTDDYSNAVTIDRIFSSPPIHNQSCYPSCYLNTAQKPTQSHWIFVSLCLLIVVFAVATGLVIFFRRHQLARKQSRRETKASQDEKLCAQPVEVLVVIDEPQSIPLVEIRSPTVAN